MYSIFSLLQMSAKRISCLVCSRRITGSFSGVKSHIIEFHTVVSKNLGLDVNPSKVIHSCEMCGRYTKWKHHHCMDPACRSDRHYSWHAATHAELVVHLRDVHPTSGVFYLEFTCTHGDNCHGRISGACGFVHSSSLVGKESVPFSDLIDGTFVVNGGCRNEKSGTERCSRLRCRFAHGRGRIKWMIEQNQKMDAAEEVMSASPVADEKTLAETDAAVEAMEEGISS